MGEQGQGRRANGKLASTNLLSPTSFGSSSAHPWPYMASPSADSVQLSFGLLYVPPHRIISFFVHWATACTRGTSGLKRPLHPFHWRAAKVPVSWHLASLCMHPFLWPWWAEKVPMSKRGGTDSAPLTSAHVAGV